MNGSVPFRCPRSPPRKGALGEVKPLAGFYAVSNPPPGFKFLANPVGVAFTDRE